MQSLSQFQTFSTSEVAVNYGLNSTQIISNHKSEHADELIKGTYYIYEINQLKGANYYNTS